MMAILRICIARKYILGTGSDTSRRLRPIDRERVASGASRRGADRGTHGAAQVAHATLPQEVRMTENGETPSTDYPLGRGYGHDYMRGGEVFGGYGYSERQEYELRRG